MLKRVFFFCRPFSDLGWPETNSLTAGLRSELTDIVHSTNIDLAERLATEGSLSVSFFETDECPTNGTALKPGVNRIVQPSDPFDVRVFAAVKEAFDEDESSHVAIFLGVNPLYPAALVKAGMDLLDQEDDVVAIGEGTSVHDAPPLWVGMKRFHQRLLAELVRRSPTQPGAYLNSIEECIVVPMSRQPHVRSINDLAWLLHEVEREILLNRWYPKRTFDSLQRMKQAGSLKEVLL